jgi:AbrB family looped-hinge helix DNA binding protein
MNMSTKQRENAGISLIKVTRNGQVTLPAEVRKALQVKEGDYIAAEALGSGVYLKPISVADREEADRQLSDILSRVKYTGLEPVPSVDELTGEIADIIHDMRRENAEGGAR